MNRFLAACCAFLAAVAVPAAVGAAPAAAAPAIINIGYLTRTVDHPPPRNNTQKIPNKEGLLGAEVGIDDNNTTGRFTGQDFRLRALTLPLHGEAESQFKKLVSEGYRYIILNLPAADVLHLADLPEAKDVMIFNARATDNTLRNADCRANVFHTISSRAMLTDALAQYLLKKKWSRWFLVEGRTPADKLYADNVRRAAKKFGAKIVADKPWSYTAEAIRRSPEAEIPVFTQGPDYDVLIVADEEDNFGDELMYRTWDPRLVAGTQGMIPTDWHPAFDRWGATQLENRFEAKAGRYMTAVDFAAWVAVRAVGEGATRTQSADFDKIRDYIRSDKLSIGVFKGIGANFRAWDNQLRQPVLLAAPYTVVSVSPQPEFIHPVSNLDTLGFDKPETSCKFK